MADIIRDWVSEMRSVFSCSLVRMTDKSTGGAPGIPAQECSALIKLTGLITAVHPAPIERPGGVDVEIEYADRSGKWGFRFCPDIITDEYAEGPLDGDPSVRRRFTLVKTGNQPAVH